jgi:hypothetical protein
MYECNEAFPRYGWSITLETSLGQTNLDECSFNETPSSPGSTITPIADPKKFLTLVMMLLRGVR